MITAKTGFNQKGLYQALILLVILLATWLRLWRPTQAPAGFWHDEAYNAMDAIWMLDARLPQWFLISNTGREPMLHYLTIIPMSILGVTPFAFRIVVGWIGILTIPLLHRYVRTIFPIHSSREWIALFAVTGLATSPWHLLTSRIGYRAILVPFFVLVTLYFFWRGWRQKSLLYFMLAGLTLGLSQYTYLPARVFPLIFAVVILIWTFRQPKPTQEAVTPPTGSGQGAKVNSFFKTLTGRQAGWLGLAIMAVVSFMVFLPMGLFFFNNPGAFNARTGQEFFLTRVNQGTLTIGRHLIRALSVFGAPYHPDWKIGFDNGLGWLNIVPFWIGLVITVTKLYQPKYLLLLASLLVLWLPGALSEAPVHPYRLGGMLPIYYIIAAVGFVTMASPVVRLVRHKLTPFSIHLILFAFVLITGTASTTYNFFIRWANDPLVFEDLEGQLYDFTQHLLSESKDHDILLPFQIYAQPTVRMLLYDEFEETDTPVQMTTANRPVIFVEPKHNLTSQLHHVRSSAFVWLTRDEAGYGNAYISRQPPPDNLGLVPMGESLPFLNRYTHDIVALLTELKSIEPVVELFNDWPSFNRVSYSWGNIFQLVAWQVVPKLSDSEIVINLYGHLLADASFKEVKFFVEIYDDRGESVEESSFSATELFRWRKGGAVINAQRAIRLSQKLPPGSYELRLSLIEGTRRVPAYLSDNNLVGDQVILGTFNISEAAR